MKAERQNFLTPKPPECQHFLNMQTQISQATLSLHSERLDNLIDDLETKFPIEPIHPKEQLPSIMYRAGQASVVAYVKQLLE